MLTGRTALGFAVGSMLTLVLLGLRGLSTQPDRPLRWLLPIVLVAGFWAWVEWVARSSDARRVRHADLLPWHRVVFGIFALYLAARFGARLAFAAGAIDPEWIPMARRAFGVATGVMFALWGNYLPKLLSPWQLGNEPFDWQGVHRFVGRLVTFAGLTMILVWLVLPLDLANWMSAGVVITTCLVVLARKLYSLATWTGERDRPLPDR